MKCIIALLLLAALVGCGGANEDEETADERKRNPVVYCDLTPVRCQ